MQSLLSPPSCAAAIAIVLASRGTITDAQPAPSGPAAASNSQQAAANKLTEQALAAESSKNYAAAIALYQQAYLIVPDPTLQYNIGLNYMFAGDLDQAERYYRLYMSLDPNGPGAPEARKFLASRPPPPSPIDSPTITQTTPVENLTDTLKTPDPEERRKRAKHIKRTGYKLLGSGAALGLAAFGVYFYREDIGRGLGFAAFLTTATGVGVCWYGNSQLPTTKSVTLSPAFNSSFAGLALTGTLP